jgi:hypothetical protein
MNAREMLSNVADWLGWQDEDLSAKLHNAFDALRLYDYAQNHPDLPEMADEWEEEDLINALGYNPFAQDYKNSNETGARHAEVVMLSAYRVLDSVAFVKDKGDTDMPLNEIRNLLSL